MRPRDRLGAPDRREAEPGPSQERGDPASSLELLATFAEDLFGDQPDPVLIHWNGCVAYVNPPFARLLGIDSQTLQGGPCAALYDDRDRAVVLEWIRAADDRSISIGRHRLRRADGTSLPVESVLMTLPVHDGEDRLLVEVVHRDPPAEA
jgi:PAS domain S-box-containing protein